MECSELEEVVAHLSERLAAMCRNSRGLLPYGYDGDDLSQDTFLRAWTAINLYDPAKATVEVWVMQIARNLVRDQVKVNNRSIRRIDAELDLEEAAQIHSFEEEEAAKFLRDPVVEQMVKSFPPTSLRSLASWLKRQGTSLPLLSVDPLDHYRVESLRKMAIGVVCARLPRRCGGSEARRLQMAGTLVDRRFFCFDRPEVSRRNDCKLSEVSDWTHRYGEYVDIQEIMQRASGAA